ncbi:conjugal transfer protein TraR [Hyphomicrobium nitrativorans NL23]|uniref:RNA polymerase-binding transcription factor DksA n=2 Tax=Hyphomicrobiaceae TaxID=45401 RepID=V5SDK4_9HYPH|nr:conjugal transfer protein TraR [Hyphomicrobium nitrativorans NL23]
MSKRATSKPVKKKTAQKPAPRPPAKSASAKPKTTKAARAPAKKAPAKSPAKKAVAKAKAPTAKTSAPAKKPTPSATKPRTRAIDKAQDKKLTSKTSSSEIVLPPDYRPSEDEPFMSEKHRMYFRQKLMNWKEEIIRQTKETLAGLHEDSTQHADLADRATSETDRALELRARDRQRKLIAKIDAALARIEDGSYGYCEETGEPIGLRRLDARPIATLSLEAQERHERRERVYRED